MSVSGPDVNPSTDTPVPQLLPASSGTVELDTLVGLKLLTPDSREHAQWIGSHLDVPSGPGPRYQLDAVLATLDLIRQSDWMAILPGLLFVNDISADPAERDFRLNPFSGAGLTLELLVVEPPQPTPSPLTQAAIRPPAGISAR